MPSRSVLIWRPMVIMVERGSGAPPSGPAGPWTCFIVVLMAIPFGAPSGRRNLFFGVAGSIFICFSFLVLQMICLAVGVSGHLVPWLAAWLPNIIFGAIGITLTLRVR